MKPWILDNDQSKKYQYAATSDKQIILTNNTIVKQIEWNQLPNDNRNYVNLHAANTAVENESQRKLILISLYII